jgi:hypothetical protein
LELNARFSDLVEEEGSAVGKLKESAAALLGAGELVTLAQLIATKGRLARVLKRWISRDAISFPVPLLPVTSTVLSVGPTLPIVFHTAFQAGDSPKARG